MKTVINNLNRYSKLQFLEEDHARLEEPELHSDFARDPGTICVSAYTAGDKKRPARKLAAVSLVNPLHRRMVILSMLQLRVTD